MMVGVVVRTDVGSHCGGDGGGERSTHAGRNLKEKDKILVLKPFIEKHKQIDWNNLSSSCVHV